MMPERSRTVARMLALLLIALGAWRIAVVVGASPLLGYANQFDMGRTSACFGLWPDLPEPARYEAHPRAPIATYVRGARRPAECYSGSELAFVALALAMAPRAGPVDLRFVGAVEGVVLVLVALLLDAALKRRPARALAHAAVFGLVIADPMVTLWLNTLYTEFAALLGAYASIALLPVLVAAEPLERPSRAALAGFALALAVLGLSRQQHLLLPAAIALPAVLSLWRSARPAASALALWVGAIAIVQATIFVRPATIVAANNADVVLGAILPASTDPQRTAARLGLPTRCLRSSGASWYETMGESLQSTCPEALALPRRALAALVFAEPTTIARAIVRGPPQVQDWRLGYLGTVEGRDFAGHEVVREIVGPAAISLAPIVTALPARVFWFALAVSAGLLATSAIAALRPLFSGRQPAAFAVTIFALGATAWYAILTAILGDGYVEVPRHAELAAPALAAMLLIVVGVLFASASRPQRVAARVGADASSIRLIVVALALAAMSWILARGPIAAMPLATGVVDRPKDNRVLDAAVDFAGWALDPLGVAQVELITDAGAVYPARYGLPKVGERGEALALYFPSYPDVERAGFAATLPREALATGSLRVRTIVVNRQGVRTEIDRRTLVVRR